MRMSGQITATTAFTLNNTGLTGGAASGAEVVVQDAARGLLYVLGANGVDALDATTGALAFSVPKGAVQVPGGGAAASLGSGNSVAISGDTLAIAFDGPAPGQPGMVAAFTVSGTPGAWTAAWRATAEVGVVPDMITFTPDGTRLLAAIEAEPTPGYTVDAQGGIAVIDVASWTSSFYNFAGFDTAALQAAGVKIANGFGLANTATALTDLEPEYITVVGNTAYVTIQEANAIGVFNLTPGAEGWVSVLPLGLSNHSLAGNGIDTSDRDGGANIRQVPVFGMYQPDAIASFVKDGVTYLVTANEGDAREYGGAFNEAVRISALVPASGSTPPSGMPALDAALLAQIQSRRGDADLGRLDVSRWAGDTDNDGDLDRLQAFGARSFSIWQVGGTETAPTITQVWNSGQLIDQIIASQAPALYDDARSDNKGAEPEHITLGTVEGQLYAFVGLERANANMAFRIDGPTDVTFAGLLRQPGDVAPETSAFIPAAGGQPARLAVANEVSTTSTVFDLSAAPKANYTLQILHGSDFEAGLLATGRADRFAAIVDRLEDSVANSITLSGGDNFIPGPFGAAGTDATLVPVLRAYWEQALGLPAGSLSNLSGSSSAFFATDIAILNAIGIQASVLGNHDFDLGTNALAAAIDVTANTTAGTPAGRLTNIGAQFPYLSANLNFAGDAALRGLFTPTLREASSYATRLSDLADNQSVANEAADAQIAPWTTIVEGGETIGILGLTTQVLAAISTVNGVTVLDPNGDGGRDNMAELAAILQPYVDQMTAQGINKIILLSHLQQFNNELALAPLLRGVDVIISAGSHAIFADGTDTLRPGDTAAGGYPVYRTGADGKPVAIVSTSGEYSYVGRLVVTFDGDGVLIADPDGAGALGVGGVDPAVSGAYVTTDATVNALWGSDAAQAYADGTRGGEVRQITDQVQAVISAKDGNVFGRTEVFLDGRRSEVRTEETNLGNLSADANLFVARQVDAGVMVSLKNGGGIRAEIGAVLGQPVPSELPPLANPSAGKPAGGVSQLDIENSLRFNNALSIVTVTAQNLERLFEHAVAATAPGATPGQFAQIGGVSFSYDLTKTAQVVNATSGVVSTAGERVRNLVILNEDGSIADTIVMNGVLQGDPGRLIKLVTLSFLADGGDGYPFPAYIEPGSRVNLLNNAALSDGVASFAAKGSEQDAFAEYLAALHGTAAKAFDNPDTTKAGDLRIQDVAARTDTVLTPYAQVTVGERADLLQMAAGTAPYAFGFTGTSAAETIRTHAAAELVRGGAGDDTLDARGGNDRLDGGRGADSLLGGLGDDIYDVDNLGDIVVEGAGEGYDRVIASISYTLGAEVERLSLVGSANLTGIGNAQANRLDGNAGANRLEGWGGDDMLRGGAGDDTLLGGEGDDQLDGGLGADSMVGGLGDDTYEVDNAGDLVVEGAGEGYDRVIATVSHTLGADVEWLSLIGSANLNGTGNALANRLDGNAGANRLDGGAGHDVIRGGAGNDTLIAGEGNDQLNGGAGEDLLTGGAGFDVFRFTRGEADGDVITDFAGNGDAAGDRLVFAGYGTAAAGASFISLGGQEWQITSADGLIIDVISITGHVVAQDWVFV
jgi:2',3'-cyclic-nucleotide 2'-phosphodiesterase (5'-nucleotidase family)